MSKKHEKYLWGYRMIHINNHRNNFEITFIKYLNVSRSHKEHCLRMCMMPNKFRNLIEFISFISAELCRGSKNILVKYFSCMLNLQTGTISIFIVYKYSLPERTLNNECKIFRHLYSTSIPVDVLWFLNLAPNSPFYRCSCTVGKKQVYYLVWLSEMWNSCTSVFPNNCAREQ